MGVYCFLCGGERIGVYRVMWLPDHGDVFLLNDLFFYFLEAFLIPRWRARRILLLRAQNIRSKGVVGLVVGGR